MRTERSLRALGAICLIGLSGLSPLAAAEKLADGLFWREGRIGVVFDADAVANIGFVVGDRCVAVIDTGGSPTEGEALQAAIAAVTPLPVCAVINTHAHPDHFFGNTPFAEQGVPIYGHADFVSSVAPRLPVWRERLAQSSDQGSGEHSEIALPDHPVDRSTKIDLGGRTLQLRAHPIAHSRSDLSVFDPESGTLWLSDLLFIGHVPVLDGSITGWLEDMNALDGAGVERVVPGHGPVADSWLSGSAAQRAYLNALRAAVERGIRDGQSLYDAQDAAGRAEPGSWQLFHHYHSRNVTRAWGELEWALD